MYTVYKHTCLINNMVYIGMTSRKPEARWGLRGQNYPHNTRFTAAIQEYGWENFTHEILYRCANLEEAKQIEIDLIAKYKANDPEHGYNHSSGGFPGTGVHCTEERKAKIRAGRLGYKCSEETRRKISEANKSRSPETIRKIANACRGRPAWNKGLTGKASHSYGVKYSEEVRRRISEATRGKPKTGTNRSVIDTQTSIVYRTAKEAAEATGFGVSYIRYQCCGRNKHEHRFEYAA